MSAPAGGAGEGVSRWQQRKAAKAMMYAMSNEQSGDAVASRRLVASSNKYVPQVQNWKGQAWGLASTKVGGRQDASKTRFSASGSGGELYYGQKRKFNTDLPPDDPVSFLSRKAPPKKPDDRGLLTQPPQPPAPGTVLAGKDAERAERVVAKAAAKQKEAEKKKKKAAARRARRSSSSSSSSRSSSSSSSSSRHSNSSNSRRSGSGSSSSSDSEDERAPKKA